MFASHRFRSAVAAAAVIAAIAAACSAAGPSSELGVTATGQTRHSVAATGALEVTVEGVASLSAPVGALRPGAEVAVGSSVPRDLPDGFTAGTAQLDVTVDDGVVVAPVTVTFDVDLAATEGLGVVLHRSPVGAWEVVGVGSTSVQVTEFSPHIFGWVVDAASFVADTTFEAVDAAADWVSGRTDPPVCAGEVPSWASGSGLFADGTFHVCLGANPDPYDGTERVEVRLRSNRAAFQLLDVPAGADWVWVEGSTPQLQRLAGQILGFDPSSTVLVAPGRTVTAGWRRPPAAELDLEFRSRQENLTVAVSVAAEWVGTTDVGTVVMVMAACEALGSDWGVASIAECAVEGVGAVVEDWAGSYLDAAAADTIALGRHQIAAGDGLRVEVVERLGWLRRAGQLLAVPRAASWATKAVTYALDEAWSTWGDGANVFRLRLVGPSRPAAAACPDVLFGEYHDGAFDVSSTAGCDAAAELIRNVDEAHDWVVGGEVHVDGFSCVADIVDDPMPSATYWCSSGGGDTVSWTRS